MATTDYHFVDKWQVEATVNEVADILEDALSLPQWWPAVYFEVQELEAGVEHGLGRLISLRAAGWLPYTLRIAFRTVESRYPYGFTMEATGDLEGKGIWTFQKNEERVDITYDWTIRANKSIVRRLSFLLKPIFRSNHNWTMRRGEESLKLELLRRRARATGSTGTSLPNPPPPAWIHRIFQRRQ